MATNDFDIKKVDWTDVAVSGAFGAFSMGIGNGLKVLQASRAMRIGLGGIVGADFALAKHLVQDAVNQTQGEGSSVSGLSSLQAAGFGAFTCGGKQLGGT